MDIIRTKAIQDATQDNYDPPENSNYRSEYDTIYRNMREEILSRRSSKTKKRGITNNQSSEKNEFLHDKRRFSLSVFVFSWMATLIFTVPVIWIASVIFGGILTVLFQLNGVLLTVFSLLAYTFLLGLFGLSWKFVYNILNNR